MKYKNLQLTPKEIVEELDKYIIGQEEAKKTIAIALRNRWRKQYIKDKIKKDTLPKNIILIGPTGSGKTEIARRLSIVLHSPFIKVEATKFTEIGYVGKDVESIIKDLLFISIKKCTQKAINYMTFDARIVAEKYILKLITPNSLSVLNYANLKNVKFILKNMLKKGLFNNRLIKIRCQLISSYKSNNNIYDDGINNLTNNFQEIINNAFKYFRHYVKKICTIKYAMKIIFNNEIAKLINKEEINKIAISYTEHHGIVFIDEIDKIIGKQYNKGGGISREGVQRDILPIIDGSSIKTKIGILNTNNILFIAAGAFHINKPSDLIPELQGRFPIKVSIKSLTKNDFIKILSEPQNSLIRQYQALLLIDNIDLNFEMSGLKEIANISVYINLEFDDIGARRLYTTLEKLLEDISFNTSYTLQKSIEIININKTYVRNKLQCFITKKKYYKEIL